MASAGAKSSSALNDPDTAYICRTAVRDPKNPGRTTGRCAIQPAKLLGTDLTYRYGGSDNTLFPFGYGLSCASASPRLTERQSMLLLWS